MNPTENTPEIKMDATALTREEVYTDGRIGTVRKLTPVTADGDVDASRPVQFVGPTQIMTPRTSPAPLTPSAKRPGRPSSAPWKN